MRPGGQEATELTKPWCFLLLPIESFHGVSGPFITTSRDLVGVWTVEQQYCPGTTFRCAIILVFQDLHLLFCSRLLQPISSVYTNIVDLSIVYGRMLEPSPHVCTCNFHSFLPLQSSSWEIKIPKITSTFSGNRVSN